MENKELKSAADERNALLLFADRKTVAEGQNAGESISRLCTGKDMRPFALQLIADRDLLAFAAADRKRPPQQVRPVTDGQVEELPAAHGDGFGKPKYEAEDPLGDLLVFLYFDRKFFHVILNYIELCVT